MATISAVPAKNYAAPAGRPDDDDGILLDAFRALGSLKLTVTLFAISSVLILVGTLAQDEMNMLQVKQRYFTSWIAHLHFDDFAPQAFYRHDTPLHIPLPLSDLGIAWIPFPGGALVGTLLLLNLIAAKVTRFHAQSRGTRLGAGLLFLTAGLGLTLLIVSSGHSADGLQGQPPFSYDALWTGICGAVAVSWLGLVAGSIAAPRRGFRLLALTAAAIVGLGLVAMLSGHATLNEPGLRILWQLIKGLGAAAVLLVGCLLIFGKQGGNVLLHFGVALLMIGQFAYGDRQLEQQLSLIEGETTNTLLNLDAIELALIHPGQDGQQSVTSIPASRLKAAAINDTVIRDPLLPVDLRVIGYMPNSNLTEAKGDNPADAGIGLEVMAQELAPRGGASGEINVVSAYVQPLDKETARPLGTYLVSQWLNDRAALLPAEGTNTFDEIEVADTTYQLALRYRRVSKPYWIKLDDVRRINYSGSQTPRDYSSFIRLVDPQTGEDRREHIWMNNPLRYRGETFYQSNYTQLPGGKEMTGLQVVQNSGWLIPYVACVITGLGMLVHFMGTLNRYLGRREREAKKQVSPTSAARSSWPIFAGVAVVGLMAVMKLVPWPAVMTAYRPAERNQQIDYYRAGEIPVQFGGRVMPLDAFARQTLKALSKKESLPLERAPTAVVERAGGGDRLSALQWLMEVATNSEGLEAVPMFRIDAAEVLAELGLKKRETKLYSLMDFRPSVERFNQSVDAARAKDEAAMSFKEKKLIELDNRTRAFTLTAAAFRLPTPPQIDPELLPEGMDPATAQMILFRKLMEHMDSLKRMDAPAIIPPTRAQSDVSVDHPRWSAFSTAFFDASIARATGGDEAGVDLAVPFAEMIRAYADADPAAFNAAVDDQLAVVQAASPADYQPWRVELERWMQVAWPTGVATILYVVALLLGLVYLLADLPRLRWTVWWMLAATLVIHTVAIVCRIVITGRPPVINLYSSAVFIGWSAVLAGLVMERVGGRGIGNLVASATGLLTLLVAYGLNTGDTMPVLQAVLDTQFWLGTHVLSVTLGYSATFLSGALGIGYLIAGWCRANDSMKRELYRMMYGVTCFGILFSFIGTVLGGLWADDSWGRFWGWDPKENGALLIVLWNALMLHARWDGMVAARGFAMLAIGGNIVTAWSWFGTNQLGIGLHSYGFTSGVLAALMLFFASQLVLIAVGWLYWPNGKQPRGDNR